MKNSEWSLTDECPTVLQGAAHAVVDVLQHLRTLSARHLHPQTNSHVEAVHRSIGNQSAGSHFISLSHHHVQIIITVQNHHHSSKSYHSSKSSSQFIYSHENNRYTLIAQFKSYAKYTNGIIQYIQLIFFCPWYCVPKGLIKIGKTTLRWNDQPSVSGGEVKELLKHTFS